jgi:hypothetical protein
MSDPAPTSVSRLHLPTHSPPSTSPDGQGKQHHVFANWLFFCMFNAEENRTQAVDFIEIIVGGLAWKT